jgi:hypothetical protein
METTLNNSMDILKNLHDSLFIDAAGKFMHVTIINVKGTITA